MASAPINNYVTPEQYLEMERQAPFRSEYFDGIVVGMAGASYEHNCITADFAGELHQLLKDTPCRHFENDMRLGVKECGRYYYPDILVICGKPLFEDEKGDTITNPSLLAEVLSASTEQTDRKDKLNCYLTIPSLKAYLLIAQDEARIEMYSRQADGSWRYEIFSGLEMELPIYPTGKSLNISDIYSRVEFKQP